MSVPYSQVPTPLLMDPDMTLSAVRVWHAIYCETLGRPGWDLSYGQIAKAAGMDRSTAVRSVGLLEAKGWLVKIRRPDTPQGDAAPNLYAVCREPFVSWSDTSAPPPRGGGVGPTTPPARGGGTDATGGGGVAATHQKNHLPEEPNRENPPGPPQSLAVVASPTRDAMTLMDAYQRWRQQQGMAPASRDTATILNRAVKDALGSGVPPDVIAHGLTDWTADGDSPRSLPAFIDARSRGRQYGQRTRGAGVESKAAMGMRVAQALSQTSGTVPAVTTTATAAPLDWGQIGTMP